MRFESRACSRWEGSRKAKAPGLEPESRGGDLGLTGSSPTRILGRRSLPSVPTWEPLGGKPVGHPSATEASRGMVGVSRTEKPEGPRSDGDAETSPFAGREPLLSYVKPEPAAQGTSPSRVVLAVIGIPGGSHV